MTTAAQLKRDELIQIAEALGVTHAGDATKGEIRAAIQARVKGLAATSRSRELLSTEEAQRELGMLSYAASLGFEPSADSSGAAESDETSPKPEPVEQAAIEGGKEEDPVEIEGEAVEESDEPAAELAVQEAESQALALREEPVVSAPALLPTVAEFHAMREMATAIAATQMVPVAYRGKPDDVLAAILTGRELGLAPMHSLREIYVIDGKPSLSANLLLARLREGGIVVLESESTAELARILAQRRDTGEVAEVSWTIEEARAVTSKGKPLTDKDNWRNYPADMLWARAVGRLARRLGSDLIGAAMPYSSEEVQDWEHDSPGWNSRQTGYGADKQAGVWQEPADWRELGERIVRVLGADDTKAWLGELAQKTERKDSLAAIVRADDVPAGRKADLWRRVKAALRNLEMAEVDLALTPDARVRIAAAFELAFDKAIKLDGPAWSLSGAEAEAGRPARPSGPPPAGLPPATETPSAAPEGESGPENAPEPPPGVDPGGVEPILDRDGNPIEL